MAHDDASPPTKTQKTSAEPIARTVLSTLGGRKFALAAVAMVVLLLGSKWGMDSDTKYLVLFLALGSAGAIAAEDIFTKRRIK